MTQPLRHTSYLLTAGVGALVALAALDVTAGPRLGIDNHETLVSLTRRLGLWLATAGLAFVALRPLRPTSGRRR
jgi:hypothetical protein